MNLKTKSSHLMYEMLLWQMTCLHCNCVQTGVFFPLPSLWLQTGIWSRALQARRKLKNCVRQRGKVEILITFQHYWPRQEAQRESGLLSYSCCSLHLKNKKLLELWNGSLCWNGPGLDFTMKWDNPALKNLPHHDSSSLSELLCLKTNSKGLLASATQEGTAFN